MSCCANCGCDSIDVVGDSVGAVDVVDMLRDVWKPFLDLKGKWKGLPLKETQGEHSTWDALLMHIQLNSFMVQMFMWRIWWNPKYTMHCSCLFASCFIFNLDHWLCHHQGACVLSTFNVKFMCICFQGGSSPLPFDERVPYGAIPICWGCGEFTAKTPQGKSYVPPSVWCPLGGSVPHDGCSCCWKPIVLYM